MAALMDLIAGETREILLALSIEDYDGLDDRNRFDAHLALGGGIDPTWLDLFSEAARTTLGRERPTDFIDARRDLEGRAQTGERTVELVDPEWISAVAQIDEHDIDGVAGSWIDLIEEELGPLPREEKPWIRAFAGDIVAFSRAADRAPAVLFAWSL
ncbi:MAG TPA: hypothetical protein VIM30_11985 [Candidatus Limnocylindrales bacterium]|jgi:hypothetical protein